MPPKRKVNPVAATVGDPAVDFDEAMKSVDIKKVMKEDLPTVSCILLRTNGKTEEVQLDMTPRLNMVQQTLGGSITFAGMWEDLGVMLVLNDALQDSQPKKQLNKHKLQPPFHNAEIYGDVLLCKSDEDGNPVDLKLKEYDDFTRLKIEEWEPEDEEAEDPEEDEEVSDEEDLDEEEMEAAFFMMMKERLLTTFRDKNGRMPTKKEEKDMLDALMASMGDDDEDLEDEEESASDDDEEKDVSPPLKVPVAKSKKAAVSSNIVKKARAAPKKTVTKSVEKVSAKEAKTQAKAKATTITAKAKKSSKK